ncbi:DUF928 domain-containing protein [Kamptonema formosum]|uniref:DUF928 domain-containing protein n=1 Tax=Kamptonema formosum TaxID=331992 RepID=UPI000344CD5A|nr:DUF928 domain-containing protein [Oscillatoria sp. PCC 10802]
MAGMKFAQNRGVLYISICADMALVFGLAAPALSQSEISSQPVAVSGNKEIHRQPVTGKIDRSQEIANASFNKLSDSYASDSLPKVGRAVESITPHPPKISASFEPPPQEGAPTGTAGGATRGGCEKDAQEKSVLTALVPARVKIVMTVAERPTLLFYIPETYASKVGFSLQDEKESEIYQTEMEISGQPGIVSVSIPPSAPALEIGKNYTWQFSLICDSADYSGNLVLNGFLQRTEISSTLAKAEALTSPLERAAFYEKNGLWLEAVANLAEARRQEPDSRKVAEQWAELLKSAGLETVAETPLLEAK